MKFLKEQQYDKRTAWWFVAGFAAGAVATFFLDPHQGRRRRILVRDKWTRLQNTLVWYSARQWRNLEHRAVGLFYKIRREVEPAQIPDNHILEERIRSAMGRKVSHPGSIKVLVNHGRVTLRGLILSQEVRAVVRCVGEVPGVLTVRNELEVHQTSENIPELQGQRTLHS